jgi:hypothetical protein
MTAMDSEEEIAPVCPICTGIGTYRYSTVPVLFIEIDLASSGTITARKDSALAHPLSILL